MRRPSREFSYATKTAGLIFVLLVAFWQGRELYQPGDQYPDPTAAAAIIAGTVGVTTYAATSIRRWRRTWRGWRRRRRHTRPVRHGDPGE